MAPPRAKPIPGLFTDITWVSLLALTLFTISRVHQYVGVIGRFRPALLFFGLAMVTAVMQQKRLDFSNLTRYWQGKVIVGLGIFACISAPFGISLGASVNFITDSYFKTLLYAVMLVVAIRNWRDLSRLVWTFVIAVGILAWLSVVVVGISKTQSNATFDANDVGLIMIVGIPLTVVTLQTSTTKLGKIVSVIVLVLAAMTVAKSQSRGAFVGLLVVGFGILVSLKTVSVMKRVSVVVGAALCMFLAAPEGYGELIGTLANPTSDYNWDSSGGRKELAKRGVGYMMQYPVFGIGVSNFRRAEGTISARARALQPGEGIRWSSPHNSYAEVAAELGIPGAIMWMSLVFGSIIGLRRIHRKLPREWRTGEPDQRFLFSLTNGLPLAIVGFAITSFFVSFAYLDPVYILAAMTVGVYVCVSARMGPAFLSTPARQQPVRRRPSRGFVHAQNGLRPPASQ